MDLGLNGRVAIVAAASKGLGRAVSRKNWPAKAPMSPFALARPALLPRRPHTSTGREDFVASETLLAAVAALEGAGHKIHRSQTT